MKVYRYYIQRKNIPRMIDDLRGNEESWVLYAYTDKKEYAKKWEITRNMKLFRPVSSTMEREEYIAYRGRYLMNEMTKINCIYFDKKCLKVDDYKTMDMVLTMEEEQVYQSCIDDDQLFGEPCTICPAIFADRYYQALKTIGYVQFYKRWLAYNDSKYLSVMSDLIKEKDEDDDYDVIEFAFDEVEVILNLFPEVF